MEDFESVQKGRAKRSLSATPKRLTWRQRWLLRALALFMGAWARTLRFHWGPEVHQLMGEERTPSVVILWHNRLFVAPEFFRRYCRRRHVAALISASGDGAWLAEFLRLLGIRPVRGSRYNRGPQAMREMIKLGGLGLDIAVTPDGSRGPMYDMKPGAVAVALKIGAPVILLSFNFSRAWRLKSWDRFYLPVPFSRIEVRVDRVRDTSELGAADRKEAARILKVRMDAITEDLLSSGE